MGFIAFLIFNLTFNSFQVVQLKNGTVEVRIKGENLEVKGEIPGKGQSALLLTGKGTLKVYDKLKLRVEIFKGPVRLRIYYRFNGDGLYYERKIYLNESGEFIIILTKDIPVYSSNFPMALTEKPQDLYLFFENGAAEPFHILIENLEIER